MSVCRNSYRATLPPKTSTHMVLKCIVQDCEDVFRLVRIPANYTFAHLHHLLQYTFGWNRTQAHLFHVHGPVDRCEELGVDDVVKEWHKELACLTHPGFVEEGGHFKAETRWTLRNVWGASETGIGNLTNNEIRVRYKYDFMDTWNVVIVFQSNRRLHHVSSDAKILEGRGGPPCERMPWPIDKDYERVWTGSKDFNIERFNSPGHWQGYLEGRVHTEIRRTCVALLVDGESEPEDQLEDSPNKIAEENHDEHRVERAKVAIANQNAKEDNIGNCGSYPTPPGSVGLPASPDSNEVNINAQLANNRASQGMMATVSDALGQCDLLNRRSGVLENDDGVVRNAQLTNNRAKMATILAALGQRDFLYRCSRDLQNEERVGKNAPITAIDRANRAKMASILTTLRQLEDLRKRRSRVLEDDEGVNKNARIAAIGRASRAKMATVLTALGQCESHNRGLLS